MSASHRRGSAGRAGLREPRRPAKTWTPLTAALWAALVLLGGVLSAQAQPFTIDWYTIDGGGGMNGTGGAFTLSGTIGQPDAGVLDGGNLDGGFWSWIGPVPPLLTITLVGTSVQVCWPSPSLGFSLQQTLSLSSPVVWTSVPNVPSDNGIIKCVTLPASPSPRFFRLSSP